ncbi:MAG: hypothetical protein HQM10_06530 [Candidatus Riflebacteria bacterium]|nr:hypothetical protein [Candidatus Riflebacteria bacterium]
MKKVPIILLFAAMFCLSCPSAYALNDWTVAMYFVADDTESDAMVKSHINAINELAALGNRPNEYEMVVLFDRPKEGAWRFSFEGGKVKVDSKLGRTNMGSPYTLWEFLKYVTQKHPAKHYALIIAGHGSGIFSWRGTGGVNDSMPGSVNFDPDRFVGYDDTDKDCLTVFEVQAVIEAFSQKLNAGKRLDLLSFDSCMPGSIEALCQLSRCSDVIVSSPETTWIGGVPYSKILRTLAANTKVTSEELGSLFAKSYVDKGLNLSSRGDVSGVYRPARAEKLVAAFDLFSIELLNAYRTGNKTSFKNLIKYGDNDRYWDIGRILTSIVSGNTDLSTFSNASVIKQTASDVLDAVKESRVTVWYSGKYADNKVAGLSLAWPVKDEYSKWRPFYKALALSQMTHWDEFLDAFHGINR